MDTAGVHGVCGDGRISADETAVAFPGFVYWLTSPYTSVQDIPGAHSAAQTKAVGPGRRGGWSSSSAT